MSKVKAKVKAKLKVKKHKQKLTKLQKQVLGFAKKSLENQQSFRIIKPSNHFFSAQKLKSIARIWEEQIGDDNIDCHDKFLSNLDKIEIYELKPQQRSILVETESEMFGDYNNIQAFYLDLPYVQFIKFPQGCYVSCSNKPVADYRSEVCYLPLPNGGESSQEVYICFGSKAAATPEKIIFDYFNRTFNSSAAYCLDFPKQIKNLRVWQKYTRLTPGFATKVNWTHPRPMGDIIADNIMNYGEDWAYG